MLNDTLHESADCRVVSMIMPPDIALDCINISLRCLLTLILSFQSETTTVNGHLGWVRVTNWKELQILEL